MRTNEGTYLQKLMQDSDRKTDLHQLGCDYLAQKSVIEKLFSYIGESYDELSQDDVLNYSEGNYNNKYKNVELVKVLSKPILSISTWSKLSVPLRSIIVNRGLYQRSNFIIGYLDLTVSIEYEFSWKCLYTGALDYGEPKIEFQKTITRSYKKNAIIEVKGHKQNPHDILQQMQTYMSNIDSDTIVILATMYPIPKAEKQLYANHGIKHIWIDVEKAKALMAEKNKEMDTESF